MSIITKFLYGSFSLQFLASLVDLGAGYMGPVTGVNLELVRNISLICWVVPAAAMAVYAQRQGVVFIASYLVCIIQWVAVCPLILPFDPNQFYLWGPFAINVGIIMCAALRSSNEVRNLVRSIRRRFNSGPIIAMHYDHNTLRRDRPSIPLEPVYDRQ